MIDYTQISIEADHQWHAGWNFHLFHRFGRESIQMHHQPAQRVAVAHHQQATAFS